MITIEQKLEKHRIMAARFKEIKKAEMDLRIEICDDLNIAGMLIGTNHVIDYPEFEISIVKKINYKLDKELLEDIYDDFDEDEAACIQFEPKLKLKEYKKLTSSEKIDLVITTTPASPSLDISLSEMK